MGHDKPRKPQCQASFCPGLLWNTLALCYGQVLYAGLHSALWSTYEVRSIGPHLVRALPHCKGPTPGFINELCARCCSSQGHLLNSSCPPFSPTTLPQRSKNLSHLQVLHRHLQTPKKSNPNIFSTISSLVGNRNCRKHATRQVPTGFACGPGLIPVHKSSQKR